MSIIISILFLLLTGSQTEWSVYFEDKKIEISYKGTLCDDIKNGVSFEYYIIKVKNKTNETLVINYYLGDQKNEENKVAFVLNPSETKIGSCSYDPIKLKLFKSETKNKKYGSSLKFSLNSIETIEVY
tara:strand:- start:50 stop:433 length:384 start_codon:yes stop_codon:yes gene_type:complete